MNFKTFFIAVLIVITIFANYTLAEDKEVPLNIQLKHLFTSLNYDNNFQSRVEDNLNIDLILKIQKCILRNISYTQLVNSLSVA